MWRAVAMPPCGGFFMATDPLQKHIFRGALKFLIVPLMLTSPSSGQTTTSSYIRRRRRPVCHSGAALGGFNAPLMPLGKVRPREVAARHMEFIVDDQAILEVNETSLDEWLELLRKPPTGKIFVRNMFPTDAHKNAWLQSAHLRPDSDVRLLLRHFLVTTGSSLMDGLDAQFLISRLKDIESIAQLAEHDRRLLLSVRSKGKYPVWEGLGWVIDLLPLHPRMALSVIDAFSHAYCTRLTDNYLSGLSDAKAIIRTRYIESAQTADRATRTLLGLDWRELEWLCGVAYEHMQFQVIVTPRGDDDGVDVFAEDHTTGQKGLVVIQAKKWNGSNPVGKREVRELLGTIDLHRATKGILVTTGRYEAGALNMAERDPRIELLCIEQVLQLLNEHCGTDWFTRVDRLITSIKTRQQVPKQDTDAPTVSMRDTNYLW